MRLLVIDNGFPGDDNPYGDHFVYKRLEAYLKGIDKTEILVFRFAESNCSANDYVYKGIPVHFCSKSVIADEVGKYAPDLILVHFFPGFLVESLVKRTKIPMIVWVHGAEALSWKRRLFDLRLGNMAKFVYYVISNVRQLRKMRRLIEISNSEERDIRFVFVSEWMRKIAETDTGKSIKRYQIIPNYIDTSFFHTNPKVGLDSKNILLVRSFDSRKYANDIAFKGLRELKRLDPEFRSYRITIAGKGRYMRKLEPLLAGLDYQITEKFLDHTEILKLHGENGIFLCPTRQDAQGVSMCEAMSSGLVPISSANTAIPEFLSGNSGYLTNGPKEIAMAIIEMRKQPNLFLAKSLNAQEEINSKAGFAASIGKEIELIERIGEFRSKGNLV